ncbi:MAG: hypothetical protein WD060_07775 [Pirellulales bacterium]
MRATMLRMTTRLAAIAVACAACLDTVAHAQVGQTAMTPAGGVLNRVAAGFQGLNDSGPGYLYYGVNGADRGLGYQGSYMTLGGFIPYAEDDLGGFWAADLRGHLSEYGGFFSNVGAVRKQFIGGTLLGVGIYWDYDGDQNQYPAYGALGTEWGQFGHAYNQVGVSGEWLTDFGNLRSNGYIPVGTTASTLGAPGDPFTGNYLLCDYGLDAALAGADLEVGAYIPGLSDWAGMISVGGYALGNSRYDWWSGTKAGQDVVPWFGGVYTRLDMTFLENWDFSLQYNNDSYFDSTGFARLTYRMGGSRRRNVPDQVEQPMMRNEHIVRAHQTPVAAVNPVTGQDWNVIHVDNTSPVLGNGTVESPVQTLSSATPGAPGAMQLATNPYDIVFVHTGNSATTPYASNWVFQADNQILVGEGSSLQLATANCGYEQFFKGTGTARPVLTSAGTAITLRNGALVDHFQMRSVPGTTIQTGIAGTAALSGGANVNDVQMVGTNAAGQVGVHLDQVPSGTVILTNMLVENMGRGVWIDGGASSVTFQGLISQQGSTAESLLVQNKTGGIVNVNVTSDTLETPLARNTTFTQALGITDSNSQVAAPINVSLNTDTTGNVGRTRITTPTDRGVAVQANASSAITFLDLSVIDAKNEAFVSQSNGATSVVAVGGDSSLSSTSTTLAVFDSNDDAELAILLTSLESAIPQLPAPPPPLAVNIQGTSTGFFTITDAFTVGGEPGTEANNISNGSAVTVSVPVP